jgi:flagellar biogenesis protein FliO
MNKYLFLLPAIFMLTVQKAFCITETPPLQTCLKTHSNEPNFMTIVFALLFVVFLIYITGIIYSKLNIVGAKTVKEHLKNSELNRAMVVSTTQLGQNKNLHVVELNEKYYLIGATVNSINLIKELDANKSKSDETSSKVNDEEIDQAIKVLYGEDNEKVVEVKETKENESDIYKKYL